MKERIIGIDLARVFSIFGMMVVNYHFAFGAFHGNEFLMEFANFFNGRASATFVILAGVSLILFSKSIRETTYSEEIFREKKLVIFKRGFILFIIGSLDLVLWPADILRSYGIFFMVASLFLRKSRGFYLLSSIASILIFTILYLLFNFRKDWNQSNFQYNELWTVYGFLKSLFFNGWNPILPWIGLFFYGMFLGVYLFEEKKDSKKIFYLSLFGFIILFIVSQFESVLSIIHPVVFSDKKVLDSIFTLNQLPPLPLYYLLSICFANLIIILFLRIADYFKNTKLVSFLSKVSTYSHTIYLSHIYLGILIFNIMNNAWTEEEFYKVWGQESIEFILIFSIISFLLHTIFANIHSKYFKLGPMEYLVKKFSEK
ncbi:MAG: heparan-alpha-glucosaminide N-acetyltransferase domain-containing protein [Leptospiraceae bacterium]|nr:heparan-alpha-glucosaminide N-acetyltransferase domain-containing protein [Leptospiraceae bacterium]